MASLNLATRSERPQLLRRDVKGRVRISRERRELLLVEFDRSGVSAAVFARMAGIKYPTFAGWLHVRRRGGRRHALKHARTPQWVEAVPTVTDSEGSGCHGEAPGTLKVHLPGGAWMVLSDASCTRAAAALIGALAQQGGAPC
jgi:hypothetical protein